MHRALETEQMELVYDCADRCKQCREFACKQPSYVEVVYCPRFVPIKPSAGPARKKPTAVNKKETRGNSTPAYK